MPLDSNIFMQYAALKAQQDRDLQGNISGSLDRAQKQKALDIEAKNKGFDLEKLAQSYVLKSEMGATPDPQEEAAFNAYQKFESAKIGVDPYTGQQYPKYRPFDVGGKGFNLGAVQPVSGEPLPDQFVGGVAPIDDLGAAPYAPAPTDRLSLENLGDALPRVPAVSDEEFAQTLPQGFDLNNIQPITPENNLRVSPDLAQVSPRKAVEAGIDYQKDVQVEQAKAEIAKQTDKDKKRTTDLEVLPILYTMIEQNAGTPDMPYAGLTQPATRFVDPEKSKNVDLLKQNQLNLAAPLAKALGVNPTDKDFQATLQRIFDINATKDSRGAQIRQLITQIENKQGVQSKLKPAEMNGKRVRQKSTGKTGQIINGEFVPD